MRRIRVGIGVLAVAAVMACDDDGVELDFESFDAELIGANEVPPVETDAEGRATFDWDGTRVLYEIVATAPIEGVVAAHIHDGEAGVNGPILVTLFTGAAVDLEAEESLSEGNFTAPDDGVDLTIEELLDLMRSQDVYVNVHTETNGGGEIRGQVTPNN